MVVARSLALARDQINAVIIMEGPANAGLCVGSAVPVLHALERDTELLGKLAAHAESREGVPRTTLCVDRAYIGTDGPLPSLVRCPCHRRVTVSVEDMAVAPRSPRY
jgi:hypothetical protein